MDKLERYLDQVCRGIAGPRSLRRHVRDELREHITDAAADHRAAGLSDEAALDKALEDFGGPEQVHSELEAAHGHSLLAVIVDNAMAWKEQTMKAKWRWSALSHVMLQLTVASQITLLGLVAIFFVPKQMHLLRDVLTDAGVEQMDDVIRWSTHTLTYLSAVADHFLWIVLASIVIIVLFEWRVRSEHKPFIRLASLGALALALTVEIGCVMAALVLPWLVLIPGMHAQPAERVVRDRLAAVDASVGELERLGSKTEWTDDDRRQLVFARARTSRALAELARLGATAPAIVAMRHPPSETTAVRDNLKTAGEALRQTTFMAEAGGSEREAFDRHLKAFRAAFARIRPAPRPGSAGRSAEGHPRRVRRLGGRQVTAIDPADAVVLSFGPTVTGSAVRGRSMAQP